MSWADDFSYAYYETLVAAVRGRFDIRPLADHLLDPPGASSQRMYWRHDIDVCLDAAIALAEFENRLGIQSTFMFMPNSRLYDLAGSQGQATLSKFRELGHELALHFDIDASGLSPEDAEDFDLVSDVISKELADLEKITGTPVHSVSFHRPLEIFIRGPRMIAGRINGYAAELMRFYISDSRGAWRQGEPVKDILASDCGVGQVLTHPIWWGKEHASAQDRLSEIYDVKTESMSRSEKAHFDADLTHTIPGIGRLGAQVS